MRSGRNSDAGVGVGGPPPRETRRDARKPLGRDSSRTSSHSPELRRRGADVSPFAVQSSSPARQLDELSQALEPSKPHSFPRRITTKMDRSKRSRVRGPRFLPRLIQEKPFASPGKNVVRINS